MSQPPGASGTAELTDPECSPAPAPWVPTGSCGLRAKPPIAPASAEESAGASRPPRRAVPPSPQPPRLPARTSPSRRRSDDLAALGELRKGFGSGLNGFVKGLGLTLQGTPSGLPDPKRRGAGPVCPRRASHLLNPPMPRSPTQHPSSWVKATQPGTGASMPQGSPSCAGLSVLRGRERRSRGAQADRTPQLSAGSSGYPQKVLLGLARIGVPPGDGREGPLWRRRGQQLVRAKARCSL